MEERFLGKGFGAYYYRDEGVIFFFFNAKVTLLMRFRKLALTMIAKTIRRGTMEARAVRRTGRSEFRFATHCLRDGPHTGLCGSTEIWF